MVSFRQWFRLCKYMRTYTQNAKINYVLTPSANITRNTSIGKKNICKNNDWII